MLDGTRIQRSLSQSEVRYELRAAEMHALPFFRAWLHWRFSLRRSVVDCNFEVSPGFVTHTAAGCGGDQAVRMALILRSTFQRSFFSRR
jgi:hypothetical protein